MTQQLTWQPRTGSSTDVYGDEQLAAYGPPVPILGFVVEEQSSEQLVDRDTTVTQLVAYLPAGNPYGRLDLIADSKLTYQITGAPHVAYNPRTRKDSHVRARLTVTEG